MKIKKQLKKFDLQAFIKTTVKGRKNNYVNEEFGPLAEFVIVDENGYVNEALTNRKKRNIEDELLNKGCSIFFPFVGPVGDEIRAVDGKEYSFEGDDEGENDERDDAEINVGDTDVLGYLVKIEGDKISFHSAMYFLGMCMPPSGPSVSPHDDCGVFSQGMIAYIDRFVTKP